MRSGPLASRSRVTPVKAQAEAEGLDMILKRAGFEWREPGCSMCSAMNPDKLAVGERCASTSNRNFEGRQARAAPIRRRRRGPPPRFVRAPEDLADGENR